MSSESSESVDARENVVFETTMGLFAIELYWDHAPKTCRNMVELARKGYFDGTIFHRIIRDFMIQGGDPTGTGRGGESFWGKKFEDEIARDLKHVGAGVVSMANSGPNTNAPTPWLDGKHTIFGRIMKGMQVIKRMGNVQTNSADKPTGDIKIVKARVIKGYDI